MLAGQSVEYFGAKAGILTLCGNGDALLFTQTLFTNGGQDVKLVVPPGSALSIPLYVHKETSCVSARSGFRSAPILVRETSREHRERG